MNRGVHPALVGLVLGVAAALLPIVARADSVAEATDLFARARELRGHGDCAAAIPLFQRAHDIYPAGLGSLRNLAECEESLGHVAAARAAWVDLGSALTQHTEPKYAGWNQDVERGLARLTPTQETAVDGAGPRQAAAPAPAAATPALAPADASAQVAASPAAVQPTRGDSTMRTAAWVGVGVAAAGLVGAGISALVRQTALDDLIKLGCTNQGDTVSCKQPATSSVNETWNRGRDATTLVNVFVAVGAVGLATGLVLFAITPSRSNSSTALILSPSGVSAIGRF